MPDTRSGLFGVTLGKITHLSSKGSSSPCKASPVQPRLARAQSPGGQAGIKLRFLWKAVDSH